MASYDIRAEWFGWEEPPPEPGLLSGGDPTGPTGYETMTVIELRAELAGRSLPQGGTKAELIERLEAAEKEPVS